MMKGVRAMLIKGATREQIDEALRLTNELFEGNIRYSTIAPAGNTRQGKPKHGVTLRVNDAQRAGARLGFSKTSKGNRRHLASACWHVHGVFFDSLPEGTEIQVGSKVQDTRTGKYRKLTTYPNAKWWDFEVGNHFEPVLLSNLCDCGGEYPMKGTWPESYHEVECSECGTWKPKRQMTELDLYDHPFDDESRHIYICDDIAGEYSGGYNHCFERLFDHSWGDFRYFTCEGCQRVICEQNPSNGWMTQYRMVDDDQICLRCYERDILENGMPREQFAEGSIGGMFFSGDNHEPLGAGYEQVLHREYITGSQSARVFCDKAMELIDSGHKVVVGFESMGIGGSEGYVSLFAKKDERTEFQDRVMEKMLENPLVSELDLRGM